jgi:hypothetical protein
MPLNQQSPRPPKPVLAANFVASLHRLMRQGAYYHKGHKLMTASAEAFRRDLQALAESGESARFQSRDGKLSLIGEELPLDNAFAKDFRKLLDDLGIVELDISPQARPVEVMEFFRSLQGTHLRLRSARGFTSVPELDFAPATIAITRKRYVEGETIEAAEGGQRASLDMLLDHLRAKGLSGIRLERCQEILDSMALLFRDQKQRLRGQQLPQIGWEDIERLLMRVSAAETPMFPSSGEAGKYPDSIADLAAILDALDSGLYAKRSQSAIDLMLLQVKRLYQDALPDGIDPPLPAPQRIDPQLHDGSQLEEINRFLAGHPFDAALQKEVREKPRQESLSILMQLLQRGHSPENQAVIGQCLRDCLSEAARNSSGWHILCSGYGEILASSPLAETGVATRDILAALNAAGESLNLLFLRDVLTQADGTAMEKIWPYVLNEAIVFSRFDNREIAIPLLDRLVHLPSLSQERWLPFMEGLSSCLTKRISPELSQVMEGRHYPLLALLTGSSLRPLIYEQAFLALTQKPPDWLMQAVAPFLGLKDPLHVEFVRAYLRHGRPNKPSRALVAMAGSILVNSLRGLPENQRREPYVAPTIRILHLFRDPEIEAFLRQIIGSKKMLFLRQWPVNCRQAAADALAESE